MSNFVNIVIVVTMFMIIFVVIVFVAALYYVEAKIKKAEEIIKKERFSQETLKRIYLRVVNDPGSHYVVIAIRNLMMSGVLTSVLPSEFLLEEKISLLRDYFEQGNNIKKRWFSLLVWLVFHYKSFELHREIVSPYNLNLEKSVTDKELKEIYMPCVFYSKIPFIGYFLSEEVRRGEQQLKKYTK